MFGINHAASLAALDGLAEYGRVVIIDGDVVPLGNVLEIRITPKLPDAPMIIKEEVICNSNENWRKIFEKRQGGKKRYQNLKGKNRHKR